VQLPTRVSRHRAGLLGLTALTTGVTRSGIVRLRHESDKWKAAGLTVQDSSETVRYAQEPGIH
jgi:hypothetical protein